MKMIKGSGYSVLTVVLVQTCSLLMGQTTTKNYIISYTPQVATTGESIVVSQSKEECIKSISYFDGLGRLEQQLSVSGSPLGYDIVTPVEYDSYGREHKKYLPYALTSVNSGGYVSGALSGQSGYYTGVYGSTDGVVAYARTEFEPSPLNRVLKQGSPGASWQPNAVASSDHSVKYAYGTNVGSEVKRWKVVNNVLTDDGYYAASTLYKTTTYDENNNKELSTSTRTEEFKDNQGKVVLKKAYDGITSLWHYTYYVYDDFDLLRVVIPPKAASDHAVSTNEMDSLCYRYRYNDRKLMVMKKLPGADSINMVYDVRDRLVLTQDGVSRPANKWYFTKYDQFNRPVMTGSLTNTQTCTQLESLFRNYTSVLYESPVTSGDVGWSLNSSYPSPLNSLTVNDVLTITYYDNYSWASVTGMSVVAYTSSYDIDTYSGSYFSTVKGQVTGAKVKVLDNNEFTASAQWICSANYYDDRYRPVQVRRTLYDGSSGGVETVASQYDFTGKVTQTKVVQLFNSVTTVVDKYYTYDHAGRLTKLEQQITGDSNGRVTVAENRYNEIGQLTDKKLHKAGTYNYLQSVDYTYNIRGWLTSINNPDALSTLQSGDPNIDLFGEKLLYQTSESGLNSSYPLQYNGNISAMVWNSTGKSKQGYGFTYDGLNRLTLGDHKAYSSSWTDNTWYEEKSLAYDPNGNIKRLVRTNSTGGNSADYTYTYKGNQLDKINSGTAYVYDKNGNTTTDGLRGFSLAYNILNLPKSITKGTDNIAYIYSAAGEKLAKKMVANTYQYYAGNMVYDNAKALSYILFDEGKVNKSGSLYVYEYHLKDHLGNTRVAFQPNGSATTTLQVAEYYPFGSSFSPMSPSNGNRYLYNGKERQDDNFSGTYLDWYDYGARFYDPAIGRWSVIDNKAEKYAGSTPYAYALNNPILFLDPDGNEVVVSIAGKNRQIGFDKYMQTASGRAYVAQFLKKGEKVQGYDFTATSTGRYANSTLRFFAQSNLASDVIGRAYTLHKGEDGKFGEELLTTKRPISKSDLAKLQQNKSFEIGVALNSNMDRTPDQWAETLGHEVFVHSVDNAASVQTVIEALQKGVGLDDIIKLMGILQNQATNANEEHKKLKAGKDEDYNQYKKELDDKKKDDEKQN